jgi:hypothetical protein
VHGLGQALLGSGFMVQGSIKSITVSRRRRPAASGDGEGVRSVLSGE